MQCSCVRLQACLLLTMLRHNMNGTTARHACSPKHHVKFPGGLPRRLLCAQNLLPSAVLTVPVVMNLQQRCCRSHIVTARARPLPLPPHPPPPTPAVHDSIAESQDSGTKAHNCTQNIVIDACMCVVTVGLLLMRLPVLQSSTR
jgi:hypothetical protein